MSYHLVASDDPALGFSLKPPKWLRKAKLGKILLPLAAAGVALLVPGVGGAVVGGLTAAARAAKGGVGIITGALNTAGKSMSAAAAAPTIAVSAPAHLTPPPTPPPAGAIQHRPANQFPVGAAMAIGALALVLASSSRRD